MLLKGTIGAVASLNDKWTDHQLPGYYTHMRHQVTARILEHKQLTAYEYEIRLLSPEIANDSLPGQFVQIQCDLSFRPYTRRPFSVYTADKSTGSFSILYLSRGMFTRRLSEMQVGRSISVVGPLGNTFIPDGTKGVAHMLVAGGVGAPPLYFLASEMIKYANSPPNISVINGARSREQLVAVNEFSDLGVRLLFSTDNGSLGIKGTVVDALEPLLDEVGSCARVYVCGPTPMLKAVAMVCMQRSLPCQVSVETMMPCGVGTCMGCVVKIRDADDESGFVYKRSCSDGPIFQAEDIIWE